jgi:hypothetical protein
VGRRIYANVCEEKFAALAERNGWRPSKRGWPDFICFAPDGEVIAVEVKPRRIRGNLAILRRDQATVMDILAAAGIRCFVSDGETLERYDRTRHAPEHRRRKRKVAA